MILTPNLYSSGKWELLSPFDSLIDPNKNYTCTAIRSFGDLEVKNISVFESFYSPYDLPKETYSIDKERYASIISLTSDDMSVIYVPDTYIDKLPMRTSIAYNHVVLSISLGAISDILVLDDIKQKIEQLVLSDLGINSNVKEHVSGQAPEYFTLIEHKTIEANRLSLIQNNTSLYSQLTIKQNKLDALEEKNRNLEEYISQNL